MRAYSSLFRKIIQEVKRRQEEKNYKKFKKIDTHEHIGDDVDIKSFMEIMDAFNIERVFLMPTGKDFSREEKALTIQRKYPDKFITFAFLDGIGTLAENHLKESIKRGAKGLKLLFWHPNIYRQNKIRMDSRRVWRLFEICEKEKIPVLAHMSFRNFPEHQKQLENTLEKFPKLIFVIPHYLGAAPQLKIVGEMLDKFPNLYTDISMGGGKNRYVAYIQGFRKRFRKFFREYSTRLFWGADFFIGGSSPSLINFYHQRISHDINLLDERIFYSPFYEENRYLFGLNLADWILERVFYKNAERALNWIM